jgi:hypothetical protein
MIDLTKTLTQLEGSWAEPPAGSSTLVTTCHALRNKPLQDLTTEDLRIMIGQNLGLKFLVPLALQSLQDDPLAEGDFYPGDLLKQVLTIEPEFWKTNADLRGRAAQIGERARILADERSGDKVVRKAVAKALQKFQASAP